jgi:DNA-binding CsgD family transcriptional regulator/PAS domain-containing protein
MTGEVSNIVKSYYDLLNQQAFVAKRLNYSALDKHKDMLETLAAFINSGVSVFDLFQKKHVFYSPNFGAPLGYKLSDILKKGSGFWDSRIHPDDYRELMQNGVSILKLFFEFTPLERTSHKLVNEYRILNASGKYVRVIEQQQALELDCDGNLWLALSTIDISPDQDTEEGVKCSVVNFKTGRSVSFQIDGDDKKKLRSSLTKRELQILRMVKEGLLSKEISDALSISLHTVNTHRQRILEKLGANNSMEAVAYASKLGLL